MSDSRKKPIKEILFIHPSLLGGGAERVAVSLASYFASHGYKFTFLLTKDKRVRYSVPEGVDIVDQHADPSIKPMQQISIIRSYIKKHPNAVIMSFLPHQNMYTLIASIGLPNRIVISVRNDPRFDFPRNPLLQGVRNAIYRKADAIVFQTEEQASFFPHSIQSKGSIILNPISDSIPAPYKGARRKAIVTSGRLEEQKNHAMTIQAFAEFYKSHPDFTLEIYGEGSLEGDLKGVAEGLGISDAVRFEGFSPKAVERVRTASVFVMSSRFEGLSNSMLEALCMGVPTICTRCLGGGAEALIDNGRNGFLIDVDDIHEATRLMHVLVTDDGLARRLSHEAQKLRTEVGIDSIGKKWEGLICST